MFRSAITDIRRSEKRLGHKLGWVFLHTPARTLSRNTRLFLIALNPQHKRHCRPQESEKEGNAYRVRLWRGDRKSALQNQVCTLYKMLAEKLRCDWESLMDKSLAGNLCPYASPSWAALPEKKNSIDFSVDLWSRIFRVCAPSVVICLGKITYDHVKAIVVGGGYHEGRPHAKPYKTGWGKITYTLTEMKKGTRRLLIVQLPHLSRYQIFGRAGVDRQFRPLVEKVAKRVA
jgi:hypothetical protein